MATSKIIHQISLPTFSNPVIVYNHASGIVTETFTIPKTGWYTIEASGRWDATSVYVGGTSGVRIAYAQITTSNVSVVVTNNYLLKKGTVLTIQISNSNGYVKITDIS